MNENAIEICNIRKNYKNIAAVCDFSLDVKKGELLSLLGVNGAGKTTLIGMLSGAIQPNGGDAKLMGYSIRTQTRSAKRVANISPQESAVAPKLTVKENLVFMARIYGASRADAERMAEEMLDELDLRDVCKRYAGKLSGGWQRRLSIAMALIGKPEILFLDEPTLGLDVLARRELWEAIRALHGKATIVMTTHYLEEAEALSDRIAIMKNGRLVCVGTPAELISLSGRDRFEDAFVALSAM